MASTPSSKSLALDTNVLLDLASGADFAEEFRRRFQLLGFDLRVTRTVLAELHALSVKGTDRQRFLAERALKSLSIWLITPVLITDLQKG